MKESRATNILMQTLCILLALFLLFPILYAVSVSFMEQKDVLSRPPHFFPTVPTLKNYIQAVTRTTLWRYMFNSLVVSLIGSVSRIIIGTMAAFAFAFFNFRGKKLLFSLTMATIMIPPDVLIVSNYVMISKMGLINSYLGICSVFLVATTNIFLLRQHFLSFSLSLREASYIDGCGNMRFFSRILLPTSTPIITTVFLSSFVSLWNQYVWPLLVTNVNEMRTIQVGITMLKDRESSVFGPVMAGVTLALIPTVLIFLIFQRKIVSGMMAGAVKG